MRKECIELFNLVVENLKKFPWENKEAYGEYLAQTYFYVRHSTRFLCLSAGLTKQEDNSLHQRYLHHIQEENAHELMIIKDLKCIGKSIDEYQENPETKSFWEPQYYKIEHLGPAAHLGYIVMLEDVAARICPWINEKLEKCYGKKAATFIRVHGEEDEDHVEEAYKAIAALNEKDQALVYENAAQSALTYINMITRLRKKYENMNVNYSTTKIAV